MSITKDDIAYWAASPVVMVRELWPRVALEGWQEEALDTFPHTPRLAIQAAKGVGKTCVAAWLVWNFLLTRADCRVVCVSSTGAGQKDTLHAELATWYAEAPILRDMFEMRVERIINRASPNTWWASFRAYPRNADPQQQADTLAGLHADRLLIVLDEAGQMPKPVLAAALPALTGLPDQHIVLCGNTNNRDSALGWADDQRRHWHTVKVTADPADPKRTNRIPPEVSQSQIEMNGGPDSPWSRINIFTEFPEQGLNALISPQEVEAAMRRAPPPGVERQFSHEPLILGWDVARRGADMSVVFPRRARFALQPYRLPQMGVLEAASHVRNLVDQLKANKVMIDATGLGAGYYDALKGLNYSDALPVDFSSKPEDPRKYANRRAEMWCRMIEWVKEPASVLPYVPEMIQGLSGITYGYNRSGQIILEPKEAFALRLGRSPDFEDALALTFAYNVSFQPVDLYGFPTLDRHSALHEYDPHDPDGLRNAIEAGRAMAARPSFVPANPNTWDPVTRKWRSQG